MRCRDARNRLVDLRTGTLSPTGIAAVREHLAACEDCAREEQIEDRLAAELVRLRTPLPFELYVADWVMARVAALGPPKPTETSSREVLAWAAAASILGAGILVSFAAQMTSAALFWIAVKNVGSGILSFLDALPEAIVAVVRFLRPLVDAAGNTLRAVDSVWRLVEPAARLLVLTSLRGDLRDRHLRPRAGPPPRPGDEGART